MCLILLVLASPLWAAPQPYQLDTNRSVVEFSYTPTWGRQLGHIKVSYADISLDLRNLPASRVNVTLNAQSADAGPKIATDAMLAPNMLAAKQFPQMTFRSTQITGGLEGAKITGALTMRGVTKPVTLDAQLYRQSAAEIDNRNLTVLLTGSINRHDFGINGMPNLLKDQIGLRIIAYISR